MELIDEIDENDELTGNIIDKEEAHDKGLWHREVTILIINSERNFLLQRRASSKKQCPNMWALTAGHIDTGELPVEGALRETEEELGIHNLSIEDFQFLCSRKDKNKGANFTNNKYDYIFLLKTDLKTDEFVLQEDEVSEVKYFSVSEIKEIYLNKEKYETSFTKKFFDKSFIEMLESIEKGGKSYA